jgi:hypothetical protein
MSNEQAKVEAARLDLDQITPDQLDGAVSECQREYGVRERCYPRWVQEGKLSKIDARDRLDRLGWAVKVLQLLVDTRLAH